MNTYYYTTQQFLPVSIGEAWAFFSSPGNLALITPPNLDFKIKRVPGTADIFEGMIIEYKLRPLLGLPVDWKTEIYNVKKPFFFTDRQLEGPYKTWEHRHRFQEIGEGVLMTDEVKYVLPFGLLGKLVHVLVVRKKIEKIFDYRRYRLQKIFAKYEYCNN